MIKILPYGEQALLINYEQKISLEIHRKVMGLQEQIVQAKIEAIQYIIPAYCSLTIGFDPFQISYAVLKERILALSDQNFDSADPNIQSHQIPVCYDPEFAWDMEEIQTHTGLSQEEIITLHSSKPYTVYMLGFLPGFPYMGSVSPNLECPRKEQPRLKIEAGSVGLAGKQTGIYPSRAPGGWQILGRTPVKAFNPVKENPFLFQAGDQVQFYPISRVEFENWLED